MLPDADGRRLPSERTQDFFELTATELRTVAAPEQPISISEIPDLAGFGRDLEIDPGSNSQVTIRIRIELTIPRSGLIDPGSIRDATILVGISDSGLFSDGPAAQVVAETEAAAQVAATEATAQVAETEAASAHVAAT
jgi:hypothetical protein